MGILDKLFGNKTQKEEAVRKLKEEIQEIGSRRNNSYNATSDAIREKQISEAYNQHDEASDWDYRFREKIKELAETYQRFGDEANCQKFMRLYEARKHFSRAHYDLRLSSDLQAQVEAYLKATELGYSCYNNIALVYRDAGDKEKTYHYYLKAIESAPHVETYGIACLDGAELWAFFNLGYDYEQEGEFDKAIDLYLQAARNFGRTEGYKYSGGTSLTLHRYEDTEKYLMLAFEHGHTEVAHNLAYAFYKNKKYEAAEKYYLISEQIVRHDLDKIYNALRVLYSEWGKTDLQILYTYKLNAHRGDVQSMYEAALILKDQEQYDEAIRYYKMAISKGHEESLDRLGYLLLQLEGKTDEAIEYLTLGIEKNKLPISMYILGLTYRDRKKDKTKARHYLQMAADGGHQDAFKALNELN